MVRKWLSKEEFIEKYLPKNPDRTEKATEQAYQKRKNMCMETKFRDAFICPWRGETYIDEERYQQFLVFKSEAKFKEAEKAARNAARF